MLSCTLLLGDESLRSEVKALLDLCAFPSSGGGILVTDSAEHIRDSYAGVILLTNGRDPDRTDGKVKVLPLPFGYREFLGALEELTANAVHDAPVFRESDDNRLDESAPADDPKKESIVLTEREQKLFDCLMKRRGRIVPREEIMNEVWGNSEGGTNVADVYISYLRKKLAPVYGRGVLISVRGQGYILNIPD